MPDHLPRERVVIESPSTCPCCGGKLAKLGETITETLEVIPRRWKVIQTVREKFTCRATGAPSFFVQVVIEESDTTRRYLGGKLSGAHIWIGSVDLGLPLQPRAHRYGRVWPRSAETRRRAALV